MRIVRVFKANIGDVKDLQEIERSCELSPWTLEGYLSEMRRKDTRSFIARREDTAVGFIIGRIPPADGVVAEILNIGVVEEFRRHGIAKALLVEFIEECKRRRISEVWLEARVSNNVAIDFYRSNDFESKGIRQNFYQNPPEDAQLMTLKLTREIT